MNDICGARNRLFCFYRTSHFVELLFNVDMFQYTFCCSNHNEIIIHINTCYLFILIEVIAHFMHLSIFRKNKHISPSINNYHIIVIACTKNYWVILLFLLSDFLYLVLLSKINWRRLGRWLYGLCDKNLPKSEFIVTARSKDVFVHYIDVSYRACMTKFFSYNFAFLPVPKY